MKLAPLAVRAPPPRYWFGMSTEIVFQLFAAIPMYEEFAPHFVCILYMHFNYELKARCVRFTAFDSIN